MSIEFRNDNIIIENNNNNNAEIYYPPVNMDKYDSCVSLEPLADNNIYISKCGHSFGPEVIDAVAAKTLKNCPLCRERLVNNMPRNYLLEESLKDMITLDHDCKQKHYEIIDLKGKIVDLEEENTVMNDKYQSSLNTIEKSNSIMLRLENLANVLENRLNISEERNEIVERKNEKHRNAIQQLKIERDNVIVERDEARQDVVKLSQEKADSDRRRAELEKQLQEKPKTTYISRYNSSDSDSDSDFSDSDSDDSCKKTTHNGNTQQIVKSNENFIINLLRDCPINVLFNKISNRKG